MRKDRLKRLLDKLDNADEKADLSIQKMESEVSSFSKKIKQEVVVNALEKVNFEINKFRKSLDISPIKDLVNEIGNIQGEMREGIDNELVNLFEDINSLDIKINSLDTRTKITDGTVNGISDDLESISNKLEKLSQNISKVEIDQKSSIREGESLIGGVEKRLDRDIKAVSTEDKEKRKILEDKIDDLKKEIDRLNLLIPKLKSEFVTHGGGNMSRQIRIDGTNYLTRYNDINFISGSGVTISASTNDTTKRTDITITASGGSVETPTGAVNGTNVTFTASNDPLYLIVDGLIKIEGIHYTYSGGTITISSTDDAPYQYIRAIY